LKIEVEKGRKRNSLSHPCKKLSGLWKYRIGGYRLICKIHDAEGTVRIIRIGHRNKVYGGHWIL